MRKLVYFSIIKSENKSLYDKIIKSIKTWNRGFLRGHTPDPRLRWKIDSVITDYHHETRNELKIAVLAGVKNDFNSFLPDYTFSASIINKNLINHISLKIEDFIANNEEVKLETDISEITTWMNNYIGENFFVYETNYDGKDHRKILEEINALVNKEKLTKQEKLSLFNCYKYFDNIFDLKMTNSDRAILMKPILNEMDISFDNNEEVWHNLYSLLRYSDDFENNRLIWDNKVSQCRNLQELRETILDNDNDGRTIYSVVNDKKIVFLQNGNYIKIKKLIKLFEQNPTSDFLDFFLSISYYYDEFTSKEKEKIKEIINKNNVKLKITNPIIQGYISKIINHN